VERRVSTQKEIGRLRIPHIAWLGSPQRPQRIGLRDRNAAVAGVKLSVLCELRGESRASAVTAAIAEAAEGERWIEPPHGEVSGVKLSVRGASRSVKSSLNSNFFRATRLSAHVRGASRLVKSSLNSNFFRATSDQCERALDDGHGACMLSMYCFSKPAVLTIPFGGDTRAAVERNLRLPIQVALRFHGVTHPVGRIQLIAFVTGEHHRLL